MRKKCIPVTELADSRGGRSQREYRHIGGMVAARRYRVTGEVNSQSLKPSLRPRKGTCKCITEVR